MSAVILILFPIVEFSRSLLLKECKFIKFQKLTTTIVAFAVLSVRTVRVGLCASKKVCRLHCMCTHVDYGPQNIYV